MDIWTDTVNYNRIFFDNHMQDPRHWDCSLIGEIHNAGLNDIKKQFTGSPEEARRIESIYSDCDREHIMSYLENLTYDFNKLLELAYLN